MSSSILLLRVSGSIEGRPRPTPPWRASRMPEGDDQKINAMRAILPCPRMSKTRRAGWFDVSAFAMNRPSRDEVQLLEQRPLGARDRRLEDRPRTGIGVDHEQAVGREECRDLLL